MLLSDLYAQQIASARQGFQIDAKQPINSGLTFGTKEVGYGDIGAGIGQGFTEGLKKSYLDPQAEAAANEFKMMNDPKTVTETVEKAWTLFQDMPKDLQDRFVSNPTFQAKANAWVERFPDMGNYFIRDESGNLRFTPSEKARLEKEESADKNAYYRSAATENYAGARVKNLQAETYQELKGQAAKVETEALKSYDTRIKEVPKIVATDPRNKMASLQTREIQGNGLKVQELLSLGSQIGFDHKKVQGEAVAISQSAFHNFNFMTAPQKGFFGGDKKLNEAQMDGIHRSSAAVDALVLNLWDKVPANTLKQGTYMWLKRRELMGDKTAKVPTTWTDFAPNDERVAAYLQYLRSQGGQ